MKAVIETRDLARFFGQVVGVSDLSLEVGPGITGLLGPNGAGKSTFLRLVVGQLRPSRGSLKVLGQNPFANRELFRKLGFCPDQDVLLEDLSALQFVAFTMRLAGFGRIEARQRACRALERLSLGDVAKRRLKGFSKGMRQRVRLAQAVAHDPKLLVLDEPLNGLDPVGRRQVLDLFLEMAQDGCHILVSSHILHEVEALTQKVLLIHRGRILADGQVGEIRALLGSHPQHIRIRAARPRALAQALLADVAVGGVELTGRDLLMVETKDPRGLFQRLALLAGESHPGIQEIQSMDAGLEAVFDYLVGG